MLSKLIEKIDKNCNNVDKEFIRRAYEFAYEAHKHQKRESGEEYVIHPLEVACILAEMGLDTATIAAGLIHDVVEDTKYTCEDVTNKFNEEVANLVEGVTKLSKIKYKTKEEQQADNVRKMLLAMTKDIRVILIKLADRLHNMRTLKYMSIEKQREKAKETLDIYAPLAHRLGISKIKWELEDLSFRYLHQNEYYDLVKRIAAKRTEREDEINNILEELESTLGNAGIYAEIDGRPKHFYSIYRKMVQKNKSIDQIFDLMAVRVLVKSIKDCYAVLGIVHTMYTPMPGRFKDYIAMPKPNMYQSLHSTVIGKRGKPFEIQIRTLEMHKTAEYGIAAHWKYKEGTNVENGDENNDQKENIENKLQWVREVIEWQKDESNAEEFMENFKIDLFSDEIFVFTPKGKVINLPSKSTPVDFAYRIHTDVGNRCIGAKVNGKIVPLDYSLKTGEIVEVLTTSTIKGPSIDWLNSVKSNQAKTKIRAWFKKVKREENIEKGKELLEKEAKKQGYNFGEIVKGEKTEQLFKKYNLNSLEDLFAAVGLGTIMSSAIVVKLKEYHTNIKNLQNVTLSEIKEHINKGHRNKKINNPGVQVKGISDVLVRFAKCCNPIPGDDIIGYITKGRGVSVHRRDCTNVNNLILTDASRMVEVSWGTSKKEEYTGEIQIKTSDRTGILSEVMQLIVETKISLEAINARTAKENIAVIDLKVKINDIEQLNSLMKKIRKLQGVLEVYRTNK